jgi:hypothetical protein
MTPGLAAMADAWHSANMVGHWAASTGSDPAKIRALMKAD